MLKRSLVRILASVGLLTFVERVTRPMRFAMRRKRLSRFYAAFVKAGDVCFDVGANVGNWTQALLDVGATVIAVEPQAACLVELRRRFGGNPRVTIVPLALSDRQGTARLATTASSTELATLAHDWHQAGLYESVNYDQSEEVTTTTLDQLIAEHGMPSLIKIDVEGFEAAVLAGLSRVPPMLSFEFAQKLVADADKCMQRLEAIGAREFNITFYPELTQLHSPKWVSRVDLLRLIETGAWTGDIYARPGPPA